MVHANRYSSRGGSAEFVVEAATEDQGLKARIFGQVESLVEQDAILASNSSHLEPERIFENAAHKNRACVIHYFFPAERNVALEIIPGAESDPEVIDDLLGLYESIGKVPIKVGSRYGYAVDPIFEGLFQASAQRLTGTNGSGNWWPGTPRRTQVSR